MSRTITFSNTQTKVKPRPLVGTKTFIKQMERDCRDQEFSDGIQDLVYALAGKTRPDRQNSGSR